MYVLPQKRPCELLNTDRISCCGGFIWRKAGLKDGAVLKLNPAGRYLEDVGAPWAATHSIDVEATMFYPLSFQTLNRGLPIQRLDKGDSNTHQPRRQSIRYKSKEKNQYKWAQVAQYHEIHYCYFPYSSKKGLHWSNIWYVKRYDNDAFVLILPPKWKTGERFQPRL